MSHVALESDGKISGKKWKTAHTIKDLIPKTTLTSDLGTSSLVWDNAYIQKILELQAIQASSTEIITFLDENANSRIKFIDLDGATFKLRPETDNTGKLGDASYYWADCYVTNMRNTTSDTSAVTLLPRTMFLEVDGQAITTDGDFLTINATRTKLPFNYIMPSYARVFAYLKFNFSWSVNAFRIQHAGGTVCSKTVGTDTTLSLKIGSWTSFTNTTDLEIYLQIKGFNGQTCDVYTVGLELR